MIDPIISIKNLSFTYYTENVLNQVNLNIYQHDFLAILGPNGGGKTTLLKIMLGLLKGYDGQVTVFNQSPHQALGKIGFVPQLGNVDTMLPISVEDVVLMGLKRKIYYFRYHANDYAKAHEVMEKTSVLNLAKKRIGELSGGQRQRVFLARALISDPKLLVFDEPTANVDPYGTACFFDLLNELAKTKSMVLVTHDLSITAFNINRIACLNKQLLYNDKPTLTKEMLPFLYGTAHPNCTATYPLSVLTESLNKHHDDHR